MSDNGRLTEVRFWAQVLTDSERTIVCSPDNESRIKCWIDARGLSGQYEVIVSRAVSDDQVVVIDENAIDAANREALHKDRHEFFQRMSPPPTPWLARHRFAGQMVDPRDAFRITGL